ncbi:MAG: phage holin, LLH family [Eubacteriales bacterium]|jgi:hypothetical protein|nr:hypothetical protein [Clostridiales bacterium]
MVVEFINTYGMTILVGILTSVASYVGIALKKIYEKYANTKIKQDVVKTVCEAVEQLYTDLKGEEKYNRAVQGVVEILATKGITITELEVKMLIESTCYSFKQAWKAACAPKDSEGDEGDFIGIDAGEAEFEIDV